jgi:hypothetical protein
MGGIVLRNSSISVGARSNSVLTSIGLRADARKRLAMPLYRVEHGLGRWASASAAWTARI